MGKIAPKPADFLSRDELRGFTARSDMAGFGLIVANWSLIAAAFALVALWTNPMTIVAAGHVEVIRRAVPELDVGCISAA